MLRSGCATWRAITDRPYSIVCLLISLPKLVNSEASIVVRIQIRSTHPFSGRFYIGQKDAHDGVGEQGIKKSVPVLRTISHNQMMLDKRAAVMKAAALVCK
jgi:hypothetical protein